MNIEMLKNSGLIEFEAIVGSTAYGLSTPQSDIDIFGVFVLPSKSYLGLSEPTERVGDERSNSVFYSLRRFVQLLATANPTLIEALFLPDDCIRTCSSRMRELIEHRHLFISKKARSSYGGYAYAQIKKAKGQNKRINNAKPEAKPTKEDFCYFIDVIGAGGIKHAWPQVQASINTMPVRPVLYKDATLNGEPLPPLDQCCCAAVEHVHNLYRLYSGGKGVFEDGVVRLDSLGDAVALSLGKGVFRDGQLVCDSIPKESEWKNFIGLLVYNEEAYNTAMRDHKNYWEWVKNRNVNRWVSQERGEVDFDVKNIMHCIRLLISGINILTNGEPIIRFTGKEQEFLMDIRRGKFSYDYLMKVADEKMAELDALYDKSLVPREVDMQAIDALYLGIVEKLQ